MVLDEYLASGREISDSHGSFWKPMKRKDFPIVHAARVPRSRKYDYSGKPIKAVPCSVCGWVARIGVAERSKRYEPRWHCFKCFLEKAEERGRMSPAFGQFVQAVKQHMVTKELFSEELKGGSDVVPS